MASIASTSGQKRGKLASAHSTRHRPFVEAMLAIALFSLSSFE
ncbi:MAG TPA: hypothetical protein VF458_17705 [Ktedonobacteraceae bacterium]